MGTMPMESTMWLARMTRYSARTGPRPWNFVSPWTKWYARYPTRKRHDDTNADTWQYR